MASKFGGVAAQATTQGGSRFGGVIAPARPIGNDPEAPVIDLEDIERQIFAQESDPSIATGMGGGFLNGATMGFGDELVGAVGGLAGATGNAMMWAASPVTGAPDRNPLEAFEQDYTALSGYTDRQNDTFREDHPVLAFGSELAGGVGTGFGLAGRGATMAGRFGTGGNAVSNTGRRVAEGAIEGAAYGVAAGAGNAEGNPLERVDDALMGGGIGSIFGAAMPVVARAASPIITPIKNAWESTFDPVKRALGLVTTAAKRDNLDLDAVELEMAAAHAQGKPYTYTDAGGRNTQGRLNAAARSPGDTQNDVANFMKDRQAGQAGRVNDDLGRAVGDGRNAFADEAGIVTQMKADADKFYESAYAAPLPTGPVYDELLRSASVRQAMQRLYKTWGDRQAPVSEVFGKIPNPRYGSVKADGTPEPKTIVTPSVRGWDQIKRMLDADIRVAAQNGGGPVMETAIALRNKIRGQLQADVPDYRQALTHWSSDQESLEAIQLGRQLATAPNADAAMATFRTLPPPQQDLARQAAARELMGKATKAGERGGNAAAAVYGSARPGASVDNVGGQRERLRSLFPDDASYKDFASRMDRENRMTATQNLTQAGSGTAGNAADMADAGFGQAGQAVGVLQNIMSGRVGGAAGQAVGLLSNMFNGVNERTAKEMVRILLSQDPADIAVLRQFLSDQQHSAAVTALVQSGLTAGAPAAVTPYTSGKPLELEINGMGPNDPWRVR